MLLLGLSAASARAQVQDAQSAQAAAASSRRLELDAELGLSVRGDASSSLTVVSPVIGARYRLSDRFGIGLDWGFVVANEAPASDASLTAFAPGNPALSGDWWLSHAGPDRWQLSASIVPPAAWLPDSVEQKGMVRAAYAYAGAARGLWNAWWWGPEQIAAALGARWDHSLSAQVRGGAEAGLAMSVPFAYQVHNRVLSFMQLAPFIELHDKQFVAGARMQAVAMTSASDMLQLSVVPYAGLDADRWSLLFRAVINLDGPLGFIGNGLGAWGALVCAQGQL